MNKQFRAASYARVSTLLNQDPDLQLIAIRQFAENRGYQITNEYLDRMSGSKEERPGLDQLISDARVGMFKVLIVTGIDRIGRNTRHLLNLIHELNGYGVALISIRESIDFHSPMGKATLTILGAIAELERELIRERIRTALASKKIASEKSGSAWRCGRPRLLNEQLITQIGLMYEQGLSIRRIARDLKVSKTTIQRAIGVPKTNKKSG